MKWSTLPKTWNRSQCCPPVLEVGTNVSLLYQVWFDHITMSIYDIAPIKNNTYFTSYKSEKLTLTEVYFHFVSNNLVVCYQYFNCLLPFGSSGVDAPVFISKYAYNIVCKQWIWYSLFTSNRWRAKNNKIKQKKHVPPYYYYSVKRSDVTRWKQG